MLLYLGPIFVVIPYTDINSLQASDLFIPFMPDLFGVIL